MRPLGQKLLASALAGGVTALAAWGAWRVYRPAEVETVALEDNTETLSQLLLRRAAEAPPPSAASADDTYPPPVVRERIRLALAREKFYAPLRVGKGAHYRFQRDAHLWPIKDLDRWRPFAEHPDGGWRLRTNALGFGKDVEVREQAPDLRIVVLGDSHTAGVVPNAEAFPNVLEALLDEARPERTHEALNAGAGGTSFYNYLGALEYVRTLVAPDVCVVAVYSGNDFSGQLALYHYYNRLPPPAFGPHGGPALKALPATGLVGQVLVQAAYFKDNPDDVALAAEAADSICAEIARQCAEAGIELVFVHLPPATSAQPDRYEAGLDGALAALDLTRADLAVSDDLAAGWMRFLAERGLPVVDMQPVFAASDEPCYWFTDLHLNTHGHRLVAEQLARVLGGRADGSALRR